ncbi:MAG TPA: DUF3488 and transglutaminase-like domain-containing protein, partial [Pirellulaceae bacterium]|nr:DUF3488 and transglutaminase-like domain-containing protein [Pirellulaceae bacterium]
RQPTTDNRQPTTIMNMRVERLLQIHMATLAALGTILLGMGQRNPVLPVVMIFAAITSVIFTDIWRWFWLNRTLGNLAALGAVLLSFFDFWNNANEQQLLAIANLLVYLQIVLLYQQKIERRYWEMAVLSLLQVVVAAAINLGFAFGVLLVVYMAIAFSALALFLVLREGKRYCAPERDLTTPRVPLLPSQAKQRSLRRRLLGDPVLTEAITPTAIYTQGIIGWGFVRYVVAMAMMTMLFSVVLFYSVPRMSNAAWQGGSDGHAKVGFSQEVTLNEVGEIRQSGEIVMRVGFHEEGSDKPLEIAGDPYFNGTVLTDYNTVEGVSRWSNSHPGSGQRLPKPPEGLKMVVQNTVLASTGDTILFAPPLAFAIDDTPREVRFDPRSGQLFRRNDYSTNASTSYSYSLGTTAFRDNWQSPIIPYRGFYGKSKAFQELDLEYEKQLLLSIDRARFPKLIALAERIAGEIDPEDRDVAARLMQDHFRTPGAYRYSLDFSRVQRDPDLDPLEDFIANHRTGHCEYFASALCLMLRSQGIPARMVVGFKGGDHNVVGGYYLVRQLHAHAWVEAYLEPDQIPENSLPPQLLDGKGAWMRLDATPAYGDPLELSMGVTMLSQLGDAMDYAQLLWDDYVLGLNSERQKQNIYTPLAQQATEALGKVFEPDSMQTAINSTMKALGFEFDEDSAQHWFSWRAGLTTIVLCSALVLLYQLLAPLTRWLWHYWQRQHGSAASRQRQVVEFYARLETLLAQIDIRRQACETQREFATNAARGLTALTPEGGQLAALPQQIVEAFYRVRFGEAPLNESQSQAIETSLGSLAQLVRQAVADAANKPALK